MKSKIILAAGLVLIVLGIVLLASNPPKIRNYTSSVPVYHTNYKVLPPGNYTMRQDKIINESGAEISFPNSGQNITLAINPSNISGCQLESYRLRIGGGGDFAYTENSFINITVFEILPNGTVEKVPGAEISIPLRGGELIPLTATSSCMPIAVTEGQTEPPTECPQGRVYYDLFGDSDRVKYHVVVSRPDSNTLVVDINSINVFLDKNITGVIVNVEGDPSGSLRLAPGIFGNCVYHYHLDAPQYVPRVSIDYVHIRSRYLDPGNFPVAIALMILGLALVVVGKK